MVPFVVVGALHALLGASPGIAGIDAVREKPVVDVEHRAPLPPPTPARGLFTVDDDAVVLQKPPAFGEAYALWPAGDGFSDGLVRARFRVGARLDAVVLVRASARGPALAAGDTPELDDGYGVSLEGNSVKLLRWERRNARLLGAEESFAAPAAGAVVEVVVVAFGPWLMATVYDAQLRRLAHVAVVDRAFASGGVGVKLARGDQPGAATGLLSLSVATSGASPSAPLIPVISDPRPSPPAPRAKARSRANASGSRAAREGKKLIPDPDGRSSSGSGITTEGEGTGAGADRVVVVAEADVARLPFTLGKKRVDTRVDDDGTKSAVLVLDPTDVERVKRAGVPLRAHTTAVPWKYVDGELRARLGKPPTKTASGFRVDESYKDAAMIEALLRGYAERFPRLTRLEEFGRSREGRPLLALVVTGQADRRSGDGDDDDDDDRPAVLLDGAHHGSEFLSSEFVLDALHELVEGYGKDRELTRLVDRAVIWCVPLVNPDGNMHFIHDTRDHGRKNGRDVDDNGRFDGSDGVDLYRNYPVGWGGLGEVGSRSYPTMQRYRGPAAASEPEVQAMMQLADREHFVASIDAHSNATKILVPYTDPSMDNPTPNEAWTIAEEIAQTLPSQINKKKYQVARNLYPVDGTAQDWFRFSFGTVALLVELPEHNPLPFTARRNGNVLPSRGVWRELLRRVVDGPGVAVRVVDGAGRPLEAGVAIDELPGRAGERWTTRRRDGRHQRLLPAPGRYTVVVARDDGMVRRVVDVPKGVGTVLVDFVVDDAMR